MQDEIETTTLMQFTERALFGERIVVFIEQVAIPTANVTAFRVTESHPEGDVSSMHPNSAEVKDYLRLRGFGQITL